MALLNNESKQYIKILFDECKVMGLSVYVTYSVYLAEEERMKDKERAEAFTKFYMNLREKIDIEEKEITAECEKYGVNRLDPNTDISKMPSDIFEHLTDKGAKSSKLAYIERNLFFNLYKFENNETPVIEIGEKLDVLVGLGFDPNWVSNPIRLAGKVEAYCGEYNGESINHSFYYNKLKSYFNMDTSDI